MDPAKARLLFAAAAAAAAALLSWAYLRHREQELLHRGAEVKVVAAGRYLPAFARLEATQLRWRRMPSEYAPKGAVMDPGEVLGMHTLVPFSPDEPLLFNKLAASGPTLSSAVPEGLRAFSLAFDEVTGVNHLLQPGDRVDVFFLPRDSPAASAGVLFQGAGVLAVGEHYTRKDAAKQGAATVTLALSPEDAQLALYASAHGILHLGLRQPGDARPLSLAAVGTAELQRRLASQRQAAPGLPAPASDPDAFIPRKR